MTIRALMTLAPHTISVAQSLDPAQALMRLHGICHLPVLDGERLVGIVSDRDVNLVLGLRDVDPS